MVRRRRRAVYVCGRHNRKSRYKIVFFQIFVGRFNNTTDDDGGKQHIILYYTIIYTQIKHEALSMPHK